VFNVFESIELILRIESSKAVNQYLSFFFILAECLVDGLVMGRIDIG
jgi:hypothetical protein